METELTALASKAATTVVALLATDAWERAKAGLGALWRRAHPERAETVESELVEARNELNAVEPVNEPLLKSKLVDEWESRIHRLLIANPDLADPAHKLVDDLLQALPSVELRIETLKIRGKASGHGQVNQLGQGVQNITE